MKNSYLLFFAMIPFSMNAQITIDRNDLPAVGNSIDVIYGVDTSTDLNNIDLGNAAGNQNWDFSNLNIDLFDTVKFRDPATTPYFNLFTNSNVASVSAQDFIYFNITNSVFEIDGIATRFLDQGGVIPFNFNPNQKVFDLPANFGDNFSTTVLIDSTQDTSGGIFDSIRVKSIIETTTNFDAWGTVKTRYGTFDALRIKIDEVRNDSVFIYNGFIGWNLFTDASVSNTRYQWFAKGQNSSLVEVLINGDGELEEITFQLGDKPAVFADIKPSCSDTCNGNISLNPIAGSPPFTYAWDAATGSATSSTVDNLCPGSYTVTITDLAMLMDTVTIIIPVYDSMRVNPTITPSNGGDGRISVTVNGGESPYIYLWSNAKTTQNLDSLSPGTYTLTITDFRNCSQNFDFEVLFTSVGSINDKSTVKIWPNPAKQFIRVEGIEEINTLINIYSLDGRLVNSRRLSNESLLDVGKLGSGMYILQWQIKGVNYIHKLIID